MVFSGYQWTYFTSLAPGSFRTRAELFLTAVDWPSLLKYVAEKRCGIDCMLLPDIGLGYNHMVRILEFADNVRWVARLRMPPLGKSEYDQSALKIAMGCEINASSLVQRKTSIPIPQIHAFEVSSDCSVKAPFMVMDCLEGNVGMDLDMKIPTEYKEDFFKNLAKVHVQLSGVQLPRIGTFLSINEDGTYLQGPIPGLGGPFDTACQFFEAWATNIEFGSPEDKIRAASGQYADELLPSISSFKEAIHRLAGRLSIRNHGPFPLCHGDFGHNNIIVDDQYHILGVIDWETAYAGPWEIFADFPLTLSAVPRAMDAPWNYDEDGTPKNASTLRQFADRRDYVAFVRQAEEDSGGNGHTLSEVLENPEKQQLITAMRLYQEGKAGWYGKLIDEVLTDGL
ncbi:uncharacterized protein RCO7_10853 [Rhynchosporium graminicola]|uniref:Aminoglycoside phosphotransferase domain-containing protein n=1 Tax=Rhynchosporium graminicola TaxID=2792576 RepID=A0A1E1LSZ7_9HELO|nr:uncharacterized protein RCO7_10853 [Rhynchosporium commune]